MSTDSNKRALETGETPAKLQKLDPELLKTLLSHQTAITELENKCSNEQQVITQQFDVKKQPYYVKRADIFKTIPHFWKHVIENIPHLPDADQITVKTQELSILNFLTDVKVEETGNVEKRQLNFTFEFAENPYFGACTLKKEVMTVVVEAGALTDYTLHMSVPDITWKENPLEKTPEGEEDDDGHTTFFTWLLSEFSVDGDFGHIFRDHVWNDPMAVFQLEDGEDDEDEEEEEEGEEGGEGESREE